MTTLLNAYRYSTTEQKTAAEANAVLRRWYHQKGKGTNGTVVLIREWPFQDKRTADNFASELTNTITGPKADGQTYAGVWDSQMPMIEGGEAPTVVQRLVKADDSGLEVVWYESQFIKNTRTYYWDRTLAEYETKVETYTSGTQGKLVVVSSPRENDDGTIDFDVLEKVYTNRNITSHQTSRSAAHIKSRSVYADSTNAPTGIEGESNAILHYDKNEKGLYDGYRETTSYSSISGLYVGKSDLTEVKIEWLSTQLIYRKITYTYDVAYHTTPLAAYETINGAFDGSHMTQVYSALLGGLWRSIKVKQIAVGSWLAGGTVTMP